MKSPRSYLELCCCILLCLLLGTKSFAQAPVNDNCADAAEISLGTGGFGIGTFASTAYDISEATVESGESFAPAIIVASQNQKSIWYKFSLSTTRAIRVKLLQPGSAITAGDAGFSVYKTNNCLPTSGDISSKLTPIITFGNTYHPCVEPGEYLVQVSSKLAAAGLLYIEVEVEETDAAYDHPENAYSFGTLSNNITATSYTLSCQSLEDADEVCDGLGDYQTYNKSTWHTFTTPSYLDFFGFIVASNGVSWPVTKIGYRLYEGDATEGIASLTPLGSCDSFKTNGYYGNGNLFECGELQPSTTYTLQLFFPVNFSEDIRLGVVYGGADSTLAPVPILSAMADDNKLGPLSATGSSIYLNDNFGCNSRHSLYDCSILPDTGIMYGSYRYRLSTFYTFELTETARLNLNSYSNGCGTYLLSIYKGGVTEDCNTLNADSLISRTTSSAALNCLEPGNYTIQISGRDSGSYTSLSDGIYYGYISTGTTICFRENLGRAISLTLTLSPMVDVNNFNLSVAGAFDSINNLNPLVPGTNYWSTVDTFGCGQTVGVENDCGDNFKKVMYRQFEIADSGLVYISNLGYSSDKYYRLYYGDANLLAEEQGAHAYPDSISGLEPLGLCTRSYQYSCLLPGTYTFATFATDNLLSSTQAIDQPTFKLDTLSTRFHSLATAEDLGSIIDSATVAVNYYSSWDYFSCTNNVDSIAGVAVCGTDKKAIFRQFYLREPAMVTIGNSTSSVGRYMLFKGKATDGEEGLEFITGCFNTLYYTPCAPMDSGWYTIVAFGGGPSYETPVISGGGEDDTHRGNRVYFNIILDCTGPQFNRPYKAATSAGSPYLVEWNEAADTGAYPVTRNTVTLPTEYFNCTVDTPFSSHGLDAGCSASHNRVAYYVFELTQESYVQISTGSYYARVYDFDVRTDSLLMSTTNPLQACIQDNEHIELCKAQPGVYTLVITGDNGLRCNSVTPTIYIDKVGYSRFDHAINAYDFGVVPADSSFYYGAVGDVHPTHSGRAPSNDFFYCTTGAQALDPTDASCYVIYNPNIYTDSIWQVRPGSPVSSMGNSASRRNLWYTFVVDKPGWITVSVENKTLGRAAQYLYSVYKSNEDGTINFDDLVASGGVDSSIDQGLTFITRNNISSSTCRGSQTVRFFREPCDANPADRYYILVDNLGYHSSNWKNMQPNHQVDVAVMVDSVDFLPTAFDHYATAGDIGIIAADTFFGPQDNYSCATASGVEPYLSYSYCAEKTLWYKFTVPENFTGQVNYRLWIDGAPVSFNPRDLALFREIVPGDSTDSGLESVPYGYSYIGGPTWAVSCVSQGTYYLLLTGCEKIAQNVYPQLIFSENEGDYCAAPVVATITGVGTTTASVTVNCHTIGTDYGEFGPELTCPEGGATEYYKSSWFRIDIESTDTLDVTAFLTEATNATPDQIKYRMMTGDCGAMQEQSCVMDALTENTYKCLMPGNSYYIQVLVPKYYIEYYSPSYITTGTITLNLNAIIHEDTCAPVNPCMANANFIAEFDCNISDSVRFTNYSTYGSSIEYLWDFGVGAATSAAVAPTFRYPAMATDQSYTVTLTVNNTSCDGSATAIQTIVVPARPELSLGNDTTLCTGDSYLLHATSYPGATYLWDDWSADSTLMVTSLGATTHWATVTYAGCSVSDTIQVYINPLVPEPLFEEVLCDADSTQLFAYGGYGEEYLWNTGETESSIWAHESGFYWVDRSLNGCTVRDSFVITNLALSNPLGNDTSICFDGSSYTISATVPDAYYYLWDDGSTEPERFIDEPGEYFVEVYVGYCTIYDTIVIGGLAIPNPIIAGDEAVCAGESSVLSTTAAFSSYEWSTGASTPSITASTSGAYYVTVTNSDGCSATSANFLFNVHPNPTAAIDGPENICSGTSATLTATPVDLEYLWNTGATANAVIASSSGSFTVIVTDENGCSDTATHVLSVDAPPTYHSIDTAICLGAFIELPSGALASASGIYADTVLNMNGCDSVITELTLLTHPLSDVTVFLTICADELPYVWNGITVASGGSEAATFTTASLTTGCDSTTRLHLNVNPLESITEMVTICADALPLMWNGISVGAGGSAAATFTTASLVTGCDSLTTLNLTVHPILTHTIDATVCSNELPYVFAGMSIYASGTYFDTLSASTGCDSIIALQLVVNDIDTTEVGVSICASELPYIFNGLSLTASGIYYDTLTNINGCDSFIVLDLTVIPILSDTTVAEICSGETYLFNATTYNASGIYTDTFLSSDGCDSITVLQLTVKPLPDAPVVASPINYCISAPAEPLQADGDNLTWYNSLTGADGSSTAPIPNTSTAGSDTFYVSQTVNGCEGPRSAIVVNVQEKPLASFEAEPLEIKCSGDEVTVTFTGTLPEGSVMNWEWSGADVTGVDPGPYTLSWSSAGDKVIALWIDNGGCSSDTASINISITATPDLPQINMPPYACIGEPVQIIGTSDGTGVLIFDWNIDGEAIENERTLIMNWQTPGRKIVALTVSSFDCPSVTSYDTIQIIDHPQADIRVTSELVCQNDTVTLSSPEHEGYVYIWSPDLYFKGTENEGHTVSALMVMAGEIRLDVTDSFGCKASDSIWVNTQHCCVVQVPNAFSPNGDGLNDKFMLISETEQKINEFAIFNRYGERIFVSYRTFDGWDGTFRDQPCDMGTYYYYLRYTCSDGTQFVKKGDLTLIR